ncbi:hypothetical protein [Actinomadura terrae]|uniref:hypothetical protein n=1 Tax=Actinomadura terrae TaxID=604353 RepID=UPI001FA752F3|nr:hypothetical protein [Actinomadura terrae]
MTWYVFITLAIFVFAVAQWLRKQIDAALGHRRLIKRHRLGIPLPPEPRPDPICGCLHHLAFHDPRTGRCNGTAPEATKWKDDPYGQKVPIAWKTAPCPCLRYVGPEQPADAADTPPPMPVDDPPPGDSGPG